LDLLKERSQTALDAWLETASNARLYAPPPPLALGPRRMSGTWRYTTTCGSNSRLGRAKIRGVLEMRHASGNRYVGALSYTQGLRAPVNDPLSGRPVTAVANFGLLLGRVRLSARVDRNRLVLRGQDSNGCSFYASK